jgi:hemerythrin-like domain-containing protein
MHDDHIAFDRRFDELRGRVLASDWPGLDAAWAAFSTDIEAHLAFEEAVLFPAYAKQGTECRALVKRLGVVHVAIRALIDEIRAAIRSRELRIWTIEVFVELMREHVAVENERIYPGIEHDARD